MTRAPLSCCLLALAALPACDDDAASGPVTITAARARTPAGQPTWGSPVAGVDVFVTRLDGSLGERGVTDAEGRLVLTADRGAWVTAVITTGPASNRSHRVRSVAGVEPGDTLDLLVADAGVPTTSLGTFMYSWQAVPPPAQTIVSITDRCGDHMIVPPGTGSQLLTALYEHCAGDSDVLYLAHQGPAIAASSLHTPVARPPGGTHAVAAWTPPETRATRLHDLPADVATVTYWLAPMVGTRISIVAGNIAGVQGTTPMNGAAEADVTWPAGVAGAMLHAELRHAAGAAQRLDVWTTRAGAIDVAADPLLPWITAAPVHDAAARTVTWTETAGAPADGVNVVIPYRDGTWQLLAPAGEPLAVFPPLPDDVAALLVPPATPPAPRVRLFAYDAIGDYRGLRNLPEIVSEALWYVADRHGIERALTSSSPGS